MIPSVRLHALVTSVLLAAIPGVPGPVPTKIQRISGPTAITIGGSYLLTRDITIASGPAISIRANRVVLDLGGHTITLLGAGNAIQNECAYPYGCTGDLRVMNGTIVGGTNGIYVSADNSTSQPCVFDRLVLRNQAGNGLRLENFAGLFSPVSHAEIRGSVLTGSPVGVSSFGFVLTIQGNRISHAGTGLSLDRCHGSLLSGNALSECDTGAYIDTCYGIQVTENSITSNGVGVGSFENYTSLWQRNDVSRNRTSGMSVLLFRDNIVENNTFSGNGEDGLNLSYKSEGNFLQDNSALGNTQCGIALACDSLNNALVGNVAAGNGHDLCLADPCLRR